MALVALKEGAQAGSGLLSGLVWGLLSLCPDPRKTGRTLRSRQPQETVR
jgi:hypothetical protein